MKRTPIRRVSPHRETVSKETYDYVVARDHNKCQLCGKSGEFYKLDLHHIHGRSKTKTNDVNNCIMLCHNCHINVVHKQNAKYRPILEEILSKKMLLEVEES